MNKRLLLLLLVPLFAACDGKFIKNDFLSSACATEDGARLKLVGRTTTKITYGDSELKVKPISQVHSKSEFRFKLHPQRQDTDEFAWTTAVVKITSDEDSPGNWLEASGTYENNKDGLIVCVPPFKEKRQIKYKVSVYKDDKELSMLDPRADLIPH